MSKKETLESLQWLFDEAGFELNKKQKLFILHFINGEGHFLLCGLAGSGKSTVMKLLNIYYESKIIFCASSGVANLSLPDNIGSGTGHSILSLPTSPADELTYKKVSPTTQGLFGSSDLIEIVVIDEVYGYNSDVLDVIYRRLERFNKKTRKRKKRNIRLLLVGDPAQQVTITDENEERVFKERWGHHLMFRSSVWERFDFTVAVFDKVERQSDKVYTACLDVIRYNQTQRLGKCLEWLNKRCGARSGDDELVLAATNKTVDRLNQEALDKLTTPKIEFEGTIKGKFDMRDVLVKKDITLCEGALVMTTNNDAERRWVNGSRGVVTSVQPCEGVWVEFDNGEEHFVEYHTWENTESYIETDVKQEDGTTKDEMKKRVLGRLTTLPLLVAYSITISKSQGLTIKDNFSIDMEKPWLYTWQKMRSFGSQFLYVALSRGVEIEKVNLLTKIEPAHVKTCDESIKFWFECLEKSII